MNKVEIVGLVASLLVIVSLLFKTTTYLQTVLMRSINIAGSSIFVVYGFLLPAYSTAITNIVAVALCTYNLIYEYRFHKRGKHENNEKRDEQLSESKKSE